MDTEKVAKLPKWAQDYITNLTRDRDSWREKALEKSDPKSNVRYGILYVEEYGLPANTRVSFIVGPHTHHDFVEVYHGHPGSLGREQTGGILTLRAGGGLIVTPHASNTIGIRVG